MKIVVLLLLVASCVEYVSMQNNDSLHGTYNECITKVV